MHLKPSLITGLGPAARGELGLLCAPTVFPGPDSRDNSRKEDDA